MPAAPRDECLRCFRPRTHCYCPTLESIPTRTRVVFLQHPREARVSIGTARMAHLALPNSELHEGVGFQRNERLQALLAMEGTALLFPGDGARAVEAFDTPPRHLVVIDGTWPQARKIFKENEALQVIPRIGFVPQKPGNYRIRREPEAHCLATIEAVVEVLGRFEGDAARFQPMIRAFAQMVDLQIAAAGARTGPPRRLEGPRPPWFRNSVLVDLAAGRGSLVVVAAEANVHRKGADVPGVSEVVHLIAQRIGTNERFEALIQPRRPLASGVPFHLGVEPHQLLGGATIAEAIDRWNAFVRPGDHFGGWGPFPRDVLAPEGIVLAPFVDLRQLASVKLKRRPGSIDTVADLIGTRAPPSGFGRAGRACAGLVAIAESMILEARRVKREDLRSRREPSPYL